MSLKEEFHNSEKYRSAFAAWVDHAAASARQPKDSKINHFNGSSLYWEAFNKWIDIAYPI